MERRVLSSNSNFNPGVLECWSIEVLEKKSNQLFQDVFLFSFTNCADFPWFGQLFFHYSKIRIAGFYQGLIDFVRQMVYNYALCVTQNA
jgi:hypothetical protein